MAKRKGIRGKYLKGNIDEQLAMTTLGAQTAVSVVFDNVVNERTLVSSIVAAYTLNELTPGADIGPFLFGVMHSDYSDTELEEWIDLTGSWNEGDLVSAEVANRKIRRIGTIGGLVTAATQSVVHNDGRPVKTKLNWILLQAQTLKLWVYNLGTQAVATTVPTLQASGHANLWPR